jgi:hypothetical protein
MTATAKTQSPHHAPMFAYAHIFVRLHTRLQDGHHVAVMTVDPAGDAVLMTLMSRDCKTYEARLDADEMKSIKDTVHPSVEVSWGAFFDLVQRCFVDRNLELVSGNALKLTLKHDRQSELLPTAAFTTVISIPMHLASPQDGAIAKTVTSMVAYLSLRTGDRKEMERVEEICRLDDQLKEDAAQITAEAAALRAELRHFKAQTDAAEQQLQELSSMLTTSGYSDVANGWQEALAKADITRVTCRVPSTWLARPKMVHNVRLLKAIKVKWPFTVMITKGLPSTNAGANPNANADASEAGKQSPQPTDDGDAAMTTSRRMSTRGNHLRYCNVVPADAESTMPPLGKDEDDVFVELQQMDDWNFSVHEFDQLCRRASPKSVGALYHLGYAVFMRLGLCARFNIGELALLEWLAAVEGAYRNVPFHNSLHAADALHCLYYMIAQAEAVKKVRFTDLQILAAVMAAILIDFDHPGSGITNVYLRATRPSYASLAYAGQAILESHHVAAGFELMKLPRFNLLECLGAELRAELQNATAQLVLATDLYRHDTIINVCTKAAQASDFGTQRDDPAVLLALILKAADVGFAAKATNVYSYWVHRLLKELGSLAELEQKVGVPVTGIVSTASAERKAALMLNFLNFVVLPTYACLSEIMPKMRITGEFIRANKNMWA